MVMRLPALFVNKTYAGIVSWRSQRMSRMQRAAWVVWGYVADIDPDGFAPASRWEEFSAPSLPQTRSLGLTE